MQARYWILALAVTGPACKSDPSSRGDTDSGMPDAAPPADGVPPLAVQFQRDVVPIFNRSCGSGTDGCHHRKTYGANVNSGCQGWLSLENASIGSMFYGGPNAGQPTGCPDMPLHARLMELSVWQCREGTPRNYAKPNDLGGSYLIDKVRGIDLCNEDGTTDLSKTMPPPDSNFTIAEGDIQTLENWVMSGAKNN